MTAADRPIVPWRFAVGVLLHLALPVYVVAIAAVLLASHQPFVLASALRLTLTTSLWFLPAYGAATVAVAAAASFADSHLRRRRVARSKLDPGVAKRQSEQRVADAAKAIGGAPGSHATASRRVGEAMTLLAQGPWRHGEKAYQALSSDLAMAVRAFAASINASEAAQLAEVDGLAAAALEQLAAELRRLNTAHDRLDHGDAKVAARYIDLRYGADKFSGDDL